MNLYFSVSCGGTYRMNEAVDVNKFSNCFLARSRQTISKPMKHNAEPNKEWTFKQ